MQPSTTTVAFNCLAEDHTVSSMSDMIQLNQFGEIF
jgi:hypothetical protein